MMSKGEQKPLVIMTAWAINAVIFTALLFAYDYACYTGFWGLHTLHVMCVCSGILKVPLSIGAFLCLLDLAGIEIKP